MLPFSKAHRPSMLGSRSSRRGSAASSSTRRGSGQSQSSRRGSAQAGVERRGERDVYGAQDVSRLRDVDDQMVTDVLCERYADRRVYTRCGDNVLLVVTPSRALERYFDEDAKSRYRDGRLHALPPHIYLLGEEAYRRARLMQAVVPVCVIGEAGSGKTEAAKEIIRYVLWRSSGEPGGGGSARLCASVDASFLVLEAFGNARTLLSPNSSRYGMLRRLYIGPSGVYGASSRVLLFDRWRVLGPPIGEFSFHALYSIVEGAPDALRAPIGLPSARGARQFACLVQGGGIGPHAPALAGALGKRDEAASYTILYATLAELGLSDALRFALLKLVVAVLHLNNVDAARMSIHGAAAAREPNAMARQATLGPAAGPAAAASAGSNGSDIALPRAGTRGMPSATRSATSAFSHDQLMRKVCALLELDSAKPGADLREALLSRSVQLRGEQISIPHSAEQADWCRRALAATLYELLFRWLVAVGNAEWGADAESEARQRVAAPAGGLIEVFDMHGTEPASVGGAPGGLDLLGINLLAEAMHARFLLATFNAGGALEEEEGVRAPDLPAGAPRPPVHEAHQLVQLARLLPDGLLPLLDRTCAEHGGDEPIAAARFASAVNEHHGGGRFVNAPRSLAEWEAGFTITHYCRSVAYQARAFVARSNEALPAHIAAVLRRSSSSLLRELLQLHAQVTAAAGVDGGGAPDAAGGARDEAAAAAAMVSARARHAKAESPPQLGYASVARRFSVELGCLLDELARRPPRDALFVCCLKPAPIVQLAHNACDRGTVLRHVRAHGLGAAARALGPAWVRSVEHAFLVSRFGAHMRRTRGLDWRTATTVLTGSPAAFAALLTRAFEVPETQAAIGKRCVHLRGERGLDFYSLCMQDEQSAVPILRQFLLDFAKRRQALDKLGPWLLAYKERRQYKLVRAAAIKLQAHARGAKARKEHVARVQLGLRGRSLRMLQRRASRALRSASGLLSQTRRATFNALRTIFDRAEAEERKQSARLGALLAGRRSARRTAAMLGGMVARLNKAARMNDIERRWQQLVQQVLVRHHASSKDYQLMSTYLARSQSRSQRVGSGGVRFGGTGSGFGRGGTASGELAALDPLLGRRNLAALEAELTLTSSTRQRREAINAAVESSSFNAGVREIVRYLVFLALFLAQLFQYRVTDAFHVSAGLKAALHAREPNAFLGMDNVGDLLEWSHDFLAPVVFQRADAPTDLLGSVQRVSTLIGAVRLEQDRGIRSTECVPPMYSDAYIGVCFPGYATTDGRPGHVSSPRSEAIEPGGAFAQSLEPFGVGGARARPEFRPRRVEQWRRGARYSTERFVLDISSDSTTEQVRAQLDELQRYRWIDERTRTLDILFTVYTPSVDVFTAVNLQVRFPETGGVRGFAYYRPFVIDRHWLVFDSELARLFPPLAADFVMLICDGLFYALVILQCVQEGSAMRVRGPAAYLRQPWSLIELSNMTLFVATFAMRVKLNAELLRATHWAPSADEYVDFLSVGDAKYTIQWLTAINCLLSFMKVFKYVTISPNLSVLNSTITTAADELASFVVLFLFIFLAFTQAFTIAFSSTLEECMDFGASFVTLWLVVIGVFDFSRFQKVSPVFGPFFFIIFVIVVFFVYINVFITIVTGAREAPRAPARTGAERRARQLTARLQRSWRPSPPPPRRALCAAVQRRLRR